MTKLELQTCPPLDAVESWATSQAETRDERLSAHIKRCPHCTAVVGQLTARRSRPTGRRSGLRNFTSHRKFLTNHSTTLARLLDQAVIAQLRRRRRLRLLAILTVLGFLAWAFMR
ncbi:MAG: hypothetical protein KDE27_29635 [Planctomycetes bacterium]|nr:hypothetical protein [Planctomycetota bacterium]